MALLPLVCRRSRDDTGEGAAILEIEGASAMAEVMEAGQARNKGKITSYYSPAMTPQVQAMRKKQKKTMGTEFHQNKFNQHH